MSINKVILSGNLGKDPESKTFPNGGAVCNFSIATSEKWKDKSGKQQERTEWHNIVCNDKTADLAQKYLKKGSPVLIEGSIRTRKYQDKEGKDRYITEIRADRLHFLGKGEAKQETRQEPAGAATGGMAIDEEIPFLPLHPRKWGIA